MPPKGVVVLGQSTNQAQAEWLCRQLAEAPVPDVELTERLGEEPMVFRVRKTPTYWNVEAWPRRLLVSRAQSEDDVGFP